MFHVYIVRKPDDKFYVRLVNSVISSTGIKSTCVLDESKLSMTARVAVERGEALVDAFINAGIAVEPSLNLSMEESQGDEN